MEPAPEATIVVTGGGEFSPEVSTVTARIRRPTAKDMGVLIRFACKILPFFIFFSALACVSDEKLAHSTFISIFVYHALVLYTGGILRRVWRNKHFRYLIFDALLFYADLAPALLFLDYLFITGRAAVKVLEQEIAPRTDEELSPQLVAFTQTLLHSTTLQIARASIEAAMVPYLCLATLTTPLAVPALITDILLILVPLYKKREPHQIVWKFISTRTRAFAEAHDVRIILKALQFANHITSCFE